MAAQLTWQEPPDDRRQQGPAFAAEAALLRENPGRSAVIEKFPVSRAVRARTVSADIRSGRYASFRPAGAFGSSTATETEHDDKGNLVTVVNVYAWFKDEDDDDG